MQKVSYQMVHLLNTFLTKLPAAKTYSFTCMINNDELEGMWSGLIRLLSQQFPRGTEESHEKRQPWKPMSRLRMEPSFPV
jgi:hypothetical protein